MTARPTTSDTRERSAGRPRAGRWRLLLPGAILLAAAAGFALKAQLFEADADAVMTALATVGDIEESVLATGILKPVKMVAVGAQVSGRITSLKVALGQELRKGDLVAEIDSLTQQNDLRKAEATLANTRAQREEKQATLAYAESVLARQKRTLAQRASSQEDHDSALATVRVTRAQIAALDADIRAAEVDIETARVNLGYTRITAPIDGTVLSIVSQEGATVNAVQSAPTIVILGQLDVMTVRAEISEADVVKVVPGQTVYFTILGDPDHRYGATLESIEPAPESVTSDSSLGASASSSSSSSSSSSEAIYYNGIFTARNPDGRLRTYMTTEVHIVLDAATAVLTIPTSALGHRDADGSDTVRVVDENGRITTRKVVVGLNDKIVAEIRSGLTAGDRVVTGQLAATTAPASGGPGGGPPMGF